MEKVPKLIGLLMITLVFSSCASVTKSKISFYEENFKDKNDAIIYVYRLKSMAGMIVPWAVHLDDKVVAVLRQNAYTTLHVNPGVHTIIIGDNNNAVYKGLAGNVAQTAVDMTDIVHGTFFANAHETYYIRSKGFSVKILPKEEAMAELINMKFDMGMGN